MHAGSNRSKRMARSNLTNFAFSTAKTYDPDGMDNVTENADLGQQTQTLVNDDKGRFDEALSGPRTAKGTAVGLWCDILAKYGCLRGLASLYGNFALSSWKPAGDLETRQCGVENSEDDLVLTTEATATCNYGAVRSTLPSANLGLTLVSFADFKINLISRRTTENVRED
ncbi:hypothetical protein P154DRAFT_574510 [Amniculicola lignicola CBS 123094]|uniref:Uncharacterized protein n=1 Tax=Amniculicola lignicola CBS 123094 TaxID=1392246 RepID=A0A6A5WLT1_9PLEO|nr:hypothetical protein P154DRAFT_574510 [Amniculicola lignicola CBS 123094]